MSELVAQEMKGSQLNATTASSTRSDIPGAIEQPLSALAFQMNILYSISN